MKRTNQLGVLVTSVRPGGPGGDAKPALDNRDVITEVNGKPIRSPEEFRGEISKVRKGDYVRLYVRRFIHQQSTWFRRDDPEIYWVDPGRVPFAEILEALRREIAGRKERGL